MSEDIDAALATQVRQLFQARFYLLYFDKDVIFTSLDLSYTVSDQEQKKGTSVLTVYNYVLFLTI